MLFTYKYINHKIEKMQEYIDHIFYEVWCKAPTIKGYSFELYNSKPDLKEVMEAFHYSSTKGGDFFNSRVERIFYIFKELESSETTTMKAWYMANNDIENLCKNTAGIIPVTYKDIDNFHSKLAKLLKEFFMSLYSNEFLSLKGLSDKIGFVGEHYDDFVLVNEKGKCPYCGLYDIDGEYVHTREAYDHFLPKSIYPFSSINFRNLSPMCNKCNSGNKSVKDPIHDKDGNRRKAFYPYETIHSDIEIDIEIKDSAVITKLKPDDITMKIGPASVWQEIETWNEIFGIEERYKAKCCGPEARSWLNQIHSESKNYGVSKRRALSSNIEVAKSNPFNCNNFLKKPFLEECERKNLFNNDVTV